MSFSWRRFSSHPPGFFSSESRQTSSSSSLRRTETPDWLLPVKSPTFALRTYKSMNQFVVLFFQPTTRFKPSLQMQLQVCCDACGGFNTLIIWLLVLLLSQSLTFPQTEAGRLIRLPNTHQHINWSKGLIYHCVSWISAEMITKQTANLLVMFSQTVIQQRSADWS